MIMMAVAADTVVRHGTQGNNVNNIRSEQAKQVANI